jgi:hypothetical protein
VKDREETRTRQKKTKENKQKKEIRNGGKERTEKDKREE